MADHSNEKNPLEQLAELLVFAPLGAAAVVREALPELPSLIARLAERGRRELEQTSSAVQNQVALARSLGEAALGQIFGRRPTPSPEPRPAEKVPVAPGGENGESAIRRAQGQVGRALQEAGRREAGNGTPTAGVGQTPSAEVEEHRASVAEAAAGAAELAIPDYESLSAAQVNARLGALTPSELSAVKVYEEGHRHRRSVLARVEALLGA